MSKSAAELIAEHLASKGATKVAADASNGVTDRQWYAAIQGRINLRARLHGTDSERRSERFMETVREAKHCGASDSEAFDEARWTARHAGDMEA